MTKTVTGDGVTGDGQKPGANRCADCGPGIPCWTSSDPNWCEARDTFVTHEVQPNFTPPPPLHPTPRRRKDDPPPDPAQVMAENEERVRIAMRYAVVFMFLGGIVGFALGTVWGSAC